MSRLRAAARRLDPWAAIVLGGLLAMGVVILLATPGPWQTVVGTEVPVRLEEPAPDDVALFVMGGRGGKCSGVVWLHLDAGRHALTAVVVAPLVSGFSPGDGFAPVAEIADRAGPGAAAAALGPALGVTMDAWIALDGESSDLAIEAMFPSDRLRPARASFRDARAAWRGQEGRETSWTMQYESLATALPRVQFAELGVVAFSNYVLGFGFVRSNLTLQGATSLAEALKEADSGLVEVRAAPVVVERSRGGEVWHVDVSEVEPLRQSLVLGLTPPDTERLVSRRAREARVLVVAPLPRRDAAWYAAEVRRRLAASAGVKVAVTLVSGVDDDLASRAARELDRRPALAALVAPARVGAVTAGVVAEVCTMLRERGQEAVVATALEGRVDQTAGAGALEALQAAVDESRLPVSAAPDVTAAASVHSSATPDGSSATPGAGLEQASGGREGASPGREDQVDERAEVVAAARANVQTLVRACWPGTLAPRLRSTRRGFSFAAARHTGVAVVSATDEAAADLEQRLRLCGFPATRIPVEEAGATPAAAGTVVWFRTGSRTAALIVADELGLPLASVARTDNIPRDVLVRTSR